MNALKVIIKAKTTPRHGVSDNYTCTCKQSSMKKKLKKKKEIFTTALEERG